MKHLTFDEAQRLDWSNDLIDFVLGMSLLLRVYDKRPEAERFRKARNQLRQEWAPKLADIASKITSIIQFRIDSPQFGKSRKSTRQFLSKKPQVVYSQICYPLADLLSEQSDGLKIFSQNQNVIDVIKRFEEFGNRYQQDYVRKAFGGTIPFEMLGDSTVNRQLKRAQPGFANLIYPLLEYLRLTIDLHFKFGLRCWWAPLYRFNLDVAEASGKPSNMSKIKDPPATLDSILGTLFQRDIEKKLYSLSQITPLKKHRYHEYLLLAMSRQEARIELGIEDSREVHRLMESWGYNHNSSWQQDDFDCLFDRLYLNHSIVTIAKKRHLSSPAIQRPTARLAKLLMIDPPRGERTLQH